MSIAKFYLTKRLITKSMHDENSKVTFLGGVVQMASTLLVGRQ